ncbi:YheT family hydrolase [Chitinophaga sp. Cy-1792]|uniref:YheT family hydrolase n=1 Tax=Chitinophaga sp. Cy-1792 TaxID=2608339 RepID=UPI001420DB45|nr:alpha/beta fold hydrolase [Chitinophaga sp. Cy-1792]NIG57427.1 alpha/beta fold hydrolase [Chitinophaga sp. Cy-1792]
MPLVHSSEYKAPLLLRNRHLLTVFPTLFRKVALPAYRRERINTSDGDFLDLDFSEKGNDRIVIILHGLEGSASRHYVLGMVHIFNGAGYDTVSMNFRGCSGEPNRNLRFYHSGDTGDLDQVISYVSSLGRYRHIHLVGFSLGGNVTLKYVGERGETISPLIKSAVAISVPCDLTSSSVELAKSHNRVYMSRFIRNLGDKLSQKQARFPRELDMSGYDKIRSFREFDDRYTAPIHGFKDALQYWYVSSSVRYLDKVSIPTLLINAADDPFLSKECYPYEIAEHHPYFHMEVPEKGGHVGFVNFGVDYYWSERRALVFTEEVSAKV